MSTTILNVSLQSVCYKRVKCAESSPSDNTLLHCVYIVTCANQVQCMVSSHPGLPCSSTFHTRIGKVWWVYDVIMVCGHHWDVSNPTYILDHTHVLVYSLRNSTSSGQVCNVAYILCVSSALFLLCPRLRFSARVLPVKYHDKRWPLLQKPVVYDRRIMLFFSHHNTAQFSMAVSEVDTDGWCDGCWTLSVSSCPYRSRVFSCSSCGRNSSLLGARCTLVLNRLC